MKKKAYERQLARTRAILDPWIKMLGLAWYSIDCHYYDKQKEFRKSADATVAMRVWCDWRYMTVRIDINTPRCAQMDDEDLERVCVHELCHVLVNEMREGGIDHEERTVTMLTKAFIWTRNITRDANTHNHE